MDTVEELAWMYDTVMDAIERLGGVGVNDLYRVCLILRKLRDGEVKV